MQHKRGLRFRKQLSVRVRLFWDFHRPHTTKLYTTSHSQLLSWSTHACAKWWIKLLLSRPLWPSQQVLQIRASSSRLVSEESRRPEMTDGLGRLYSSSLPNLQPIKWLTQSIMSDKNSQNIHISWMENAEQKQRWFARNNSWIFSVGLRFV